MRDFQHTRFLEEDEPPFTFPPKCLTPVVTPSPWIWRSAVILAIVAGAVAGLAVRAYCLS